MLNSSMYLMTSTAESFGIVLVEAMSCGVPCIIFDSAKGACELIKDKYNGYIIKDRNQKKYIDMIVKLFKNNKELLKLGKNSKEFSTNFNEEKIESEWLKIMK